MSRATHAAFGGIVLFRLDLITSGALRVAFNAQDKRFVKGWHTRAKYNNLHDKYNFMYFYFILWCFENVHMANLLAMKYFSFLPYATMFSFFEYTVFKVVLFFYVKIVCLHDMTSGHV